MVEIRIDPGFARPQCFETEAASMAEAVHLWLLDGRDMMAVSQAHQWESLSAAERLRADKLRSQAARDRFVAIRAWMRRLLGGYLGCGAEVVEFTLNEHGKPRLAGAVDGEGWVFNLSHTGEFAVLAVARDTLLGVDIEIVRVRRNLEGLAAACLAPEERLWWRRSSEEERLSDFFDLWVSKEAYVKAVGRGIALGLNRVVIRQDFTGFTGMPPEYGPVGDWHLHLWSHGPARIALTYKGAPRSIKLIECAAAAPMSGKC